MSDEPTVAGPDRSAPAPRPDPVAFGRALTSGLGINLLVRSVPHALEFQRHVLGAEVAYAEEHFAVVQAVGSTWLLHSDWSYRDHELSGAVAGVEVRGAGVELRLYGVDPDRAEAAARARGATILSAACDKPHGLREAHLVDEDGYVWVPCIAT